MKAMKFALLGTAALVAVSVSARADDLTDMKAQLEALQASVAGLQSGVDVPAGYQMVSFSKVGNEHLISIMPTADMPASTVLSWSGYVRTALVGSWSNTTAIAPNATTFQTRTKTSTTNSSHIKARGDLTFTGKTDTAVGEVGGTVELRYDFDGTYLGYGVTMPTAKGWWKMTPNVTLAGGYMGMTGGVGGYGGDALTNYYTDGIPNSSGNPGDTTGFSLAYADGPMSLTVAVGHYATSDYAFGAAAEYKGDAMSAKVAGYIHDADYQAGLGLATTMGMFSLSASAAMGHTASQYFSTWNDNSYETANYWNASLIGKAKMSDSVSAELGVGYNDYVATTNSVWNSHQFGVAGGLYYSPVSQLTIGLEGSYNSTYTHQDWVAFQTKNTTKVDLVTVFAF